MGRNLPKKVKIGKNNLLGGAPYLTIATVLRLFVKLIQDFPNMRKLVLKNREHCALEVAVDIRLERC